MSSHNSTIQQGNSYTVSVDREYDLADDDSCWVHVTGKNIASTTKSVGAIFDEADKNGDGRITRIELKKFFQKKGIHVWSDTEFTEIWRDADSDRDNFISYAEFSSVMKRAKTTYAGHSKWQTLLNAMKSESGVPLDIRLFKIDSYGGVSHVGSKALVGNKTKNIESFFSKRNFIAGYEYFVTVHEDDGGDGKEVAKSSRIKCIDSDAMLRARQAQMQRRRQEALKEERAQKLRQQESRAALARARAEREQEKMDRLAAQLRQQSKEDLIRRIDERKNAARRAAEERRNYVSFNAVRVIDQAFDEIDTNGNGIISYAEFSNYVKKHGVSSKDVKNMFDVADSSYGDDDGQISRQEFRDVMNAAGGAGVSPAWNKLYKTYAASVGTKRGTGGRGGGGARPAKRARPRR